MQDKVSMTILLTSARWLILAQAQNSNPRKDVIAFAQTYFAVQTRKKEIIDKVKQHLLEEEV